MICDRTAKDAEFITRSQQSVEVRRQAKRERLRKVAPFMLAAMVSILITLFVGLVVTKAIANTAHDLHHTICTAPSCF